VLLLVAAGCGRSSSSKASSSGTTGAAGAAAKPTGDFGTLKAVCGPGNATGATAPGVTNTSINVATMSDPGFVGLPGLDQELFDSADAFVGWCNAAGGILGRKIVLHKRDAALTQVAAKMVESCQAPDFMLVGNGEALDATGVQQRLSCGLPEISGYDVSAAAGTAPMSVQFNPTSDHMGSSTGGYRVLAKVDPEAIKHYGMLSSNQQSVKDAGNRNRAAAESLGYVTVDYEELPPTVDNWRPIAENLHSHGVQVLTAENAPDNMAALFKTLSDIGYFPKWVIFDGNMYDGKFTAGAGAALNGFKGGVFVDTYVYPFELANDNPATAQYVSLLNQYVGGAKPKSLGINGFSAWLLFAESAKACGSNLTRTCVVDHAGATKNWTGGGLHAPSQPGNASSPVNECFTLLQATPTGFTVNKTVTQPNNGIYNCSPANQINLPGFPPKS
jgi:ABC-type branched-subunit amino acid transport system substrate-binding protein